MALTSKGRFIINGTYEFVPKSIKVNLESLVSDDSGRTTDGVMHIYWVMRKVRKIEIEMPPTADRSNLSLLFSLVQGQEYNLTYWDPLENAEKTINVYTSNSSTDLYSGVLYNGLWQGIKFNAIELAGETE